MKQRIFISYTLRDNEISTELLFNLKERSKICGVDTYIDIIDNKNGGDYQKNIFKWLRKADYLYLIETKGSYHSPWVEKELNFANRFNIPIITIPLQKIEHFIASPTDKTNSLFCNIQSTKQLKS